MTSRRAQPVRGVSLLEALIACLVLALGMLSVARLQSQLRLSADIARQRAEAVRLAQQDLERLRSFGVLESAAGARAYADIADAVATVDASAQGTNTRYTLTRRIDAATTPGALNVSASVAWNDRTGAAQQVLLASIIAGADPAHGGALATAARPASPQGAYGRSRHIPLAARDLGNGSSVFKPVSDGTVALVLDNASGAVTSRCTGIAAATPTRQLVAADLTSCDGLRGLLLSGSVRFGAGNDAPLALGIDIALTGGSYDHAPVCSSEALKTVAAGAAPGLHVDAVPLAATLAGGSDTGERYVAYHCVVYPLADGSWSGRSRLLASGWTIGSGSGDRRVCRHSADQDGSGAVELNVEHPNAYSRVTAALAHQNFLVVPGTQACPAAGAVSVTGSANDVFVDATTLNHQP